MWFLQALLKKRLSFRCIYDFSLFVPGVTWQKLKLALCIWQQQKLGLCIGLVSVVLPGVTWKTPQFSLYIWFWCVCSGCNMTKTKISIMHMAKTKISIINIIRECDCSRLYFKNASIFIFSVFVPGVTWQKQKLALCLWLVSVILPGITWQRH